MQLSSKITLLLIALSSLFGLYVVPVYALDTGWECESSYTNLRATCALQNQCAQTLNCYPQDGCSMICEFFDDTINLNDPEDATQDYYYSCTTTAGQTYTCKPSPSNDECNHLLSQPSYNCSLVDGNSLESGSASSTTPSPLSRSLFPETDGRFIPKGCTDGPAYVSKGSEDERCGINEVLIVAVNVSRLILGTLGSVALVMFIYGGFMFMIAMGSTERVRQGQTIILNAIIGIVIVLFAWIIINLVVSALTGTGIGNPTIFDGQAPLSTPKTQSFNAPAEKFEFGGGGGFGGGAGGSW